MLPKERRIEKRLFPKLMKEGANFFYPYFSIKVTPLGSPTLPSKFSFVVSSKVISGAVGRNLLKRRARAIIRKHLNSVKLGYAIVFFFKKPVNTLKFSQLEEEVIKSLTKSKLIQNVTF